MTTPEKADRDRPLPPEDRKALAAMVMQLFERWQVNDTEKAELLGLSTSNAMALDKLLSDNAMGLSRETKERLGLLLGIHSRLRRLFPGNPELAHRWMTSANRSFEEITPVAVVQAQGLSGLLAIRAYLDQAIHR